MSVESIIKQHGSAASTQRPTSGVDDYGAESLSFATQIASLKAYITTGGGGESVRYGRLNNQYGLMGYILPGQDVLEKDRLVVGSDTYEITSVQTPNLRASNDYLAFMVLVLEKTKP